MRSLNPPLTKDDFLNSSWQDAIASSESKECSAYYAVFSRRGQESGQAGNEREQAVFEILATVSWLAIERQYSNPEPISGFLNSLTPEQWDFLAEIATEVSDPELQARITDILWSRPRDRRDRRDYQMAQLAVDAYLKSATILEDPEKWTLCFDRIARALQLSCQIKYHFEKVVGHIEAVLSHYNGEDPLWLSAKLMELLQEKKLGDSTKYAALAENAAKLAEKNCDWDRARNYWEIKARWHLIEKDGEKERAAAMLAAETYVKEAEDINQQVPSYLVASKYMQQAVEAFRNVRGTKEETADAKKRAEEVHKLLIEYQEKSVLELHKIYLEKPIDVDVIERVIACVRGKSFQDALFALAISIPIPPGAVSKLRQEVQQSAQAAIAYTFFPKKIVNKKGKVTAQQPGSTDTHEAEEAMRFEMYNRAAMYQNYFAQVFIEPAREQINLEHRIEIEDLLPIVSDSPFVPPDRKHLFAKGLYAGLIGDFITSTHVLIPQIENSVRCLLPQRGAITSSLDLEKGIQNEHDLNRTLHLQEIKDIFGEDTLFDLQELLVKHSGTNLRNRMAHGLIDDEEFSSPMMSYLWWVTLRLCCLPIYTYQQQVKSSDPWVQFAGIFKDDPLFDEFVEAMAAERRKLDAEMAAYDAANEENQPA